MVGKVASMVRTQVVFRGCRVLAADTMATFLDGLELADFGGLLRPVARMHIGANLIKTLTVSIVKGICVERGCPYDVSRILSERSERVQSHLSVFLSR